MSAALSFREIIIQSLQSELQPTHIEVIDESHMHSRRTQHNKETHFKLVIVSEAFKNLPKVKRQQLVYSHLSALFDKGLHALSQSTFTPEEWAAQPAIHESPDCGHKMLKR